MSLCVVVIYEGYTCSGTHVAVIYDGVLIALCIYVGSIYVECIYEAACKHSNKCATGCKVTGKRTARVDRLAAGKLASSHSA